MIRIVSVNIQEDLHIDKITKLLEKEAPDVVCMQEVFQSDLEHFEKTFSMKSVFAGRAFRLSPMNPHLPEKLCGNAIFTKKKILSTNTYYYYKSSEEIPVFRDSPDLRKEIEPLNYPVVVARIVHEEKEYTIATTHLPVTYHGEEADFQTECVKKLLEYFQKFLEIIFTGDMNAPRGGKAFGEFCKVYKDNIPLEYTTSLDSDLHKASKEALATQAKALGIPGYMVDGLFTTPHYIAQNVRLVGGVSDHMAVVGEVDKVK